MLLKVASWTAEVSALADGVATWPHVAYCAFAHGIIGRWIYVMRTIPNTDSLFEPLEDVICFKLIASLTGMVYVLLLNRSCFFLVVLILWILLLILLILDTMLPSKLPTLLRNLILQQSVATQLPLLNLASFVSPIKTHIHKCNSLHLEAGEYTQSLCICGSPFIPDYTMICRHCGLTFVHHNEI